MTYAQPSQIANSISTAISNTIMSAIQTSQNSYTSKQNINISCDPDINKYIYDQFDKCVESLKKLNWSKNDIKKLCTIPVFCKADNISMKNSANITNLTDQESEIKSNISNSISNNISQSLSKLSPDILSLLAAGNKDISQYISSITKVVTNNVSSITQDLYINIQNSSTLSLTNYAAYNVNLNQISNISNNFVQTNKTIQDSINNISNLLSQKATNSQNSFMNTIQKVFIIVITMISVVFIFLFFLKRKNTQQFVSFIMPYVIFFSFSAVVFYINIYVKPKWVLIDNNTTDDKIDRGKLLFYSALPIILFGLIEIFYFRYKKSHKLSKDVKNTSNKSTQIQEKTTKQPEKTHSTTKVVVK